MHSRSLLQKFRSCVSWGNSDTNFVFDKLEMMDDNCGKCRNCERNLLKSSLKYQCQSCGKLMCENCIQGLTSIGVGSSHLTGESRAMFSIKSCKLCFELGPLGKSGQKCSGKVYPSEIPRHSPEPPSSPDFSGNHSPPEWTRSSDASFLNHSFLSSAHCSPSRSDEDEGEDLTSHFFNAPVECLHGASDVDSCRLTARHEFCSSLSVGSSPSDSPSSLHITSAGARHHVQGEQGITERSQNDGPFDEEQAVMERPAKGVWASENTNNLSIFKHKYENLTKPFDFETNGLIWFPPPPDDVNAEVEKNILTYDDEDDEVGDSDAMFFPAVLDNIFLSRKQLHLDRQEVWKTVVEGHFRALVSQLLGGHGIIATKDNCDENWLDIITALAWQAAKFIKPDRSKGGSMDPCDYLKVKCVASGRPSECKFIKGVVCTKNLKHKRMMTQYKNARLLLLGGALESQKISNKLASFETLLQQENDHLKTILSKIEAHHPNVLLVERSVSSFALQHLLAKEISLVLNVKRPLLERIARCTGASITPSTDHISTTKLGYCELFHLEKISEDHEPVNQFNKKPSKTLMFFEGCPWRLGCTVVLRGSCREELKKIKHVVQYAVFAAYHLLLETSFLADEGATLPKLAAKSLNAMPDDVTLHNTISVIPEFEATASHTEETNVSDGNIESANHTSELGLQKTLSELSGTSSFDHVTMPDEFRFRKILLDACGENLALELMSNEMKSTSPSIRNHLLTEYLDQSVVQYHEVEVKQTPLNVGDADSPSESISVNDNRQSILVSFTSHHMANGTVCERSQLLRLKFYGQSDKPLGRYLRGLFDQSYLCLSCKEPAEAHVLCYTHQQANLTINVKHLPSVNLPGAKDGKIWMWHRCLGCDQIEGVPPATRRVVMSNAAWGLSFGKFLELSFSNHATGNRVASCGHSLQRDCLRFYGFGSMVAFFRYSPINILSVRLPPSILEFSGPGEQGWITKEARELLSKAEALCDEISGVLEELKVKSLICVNEFSDASDLHDHVLELIRMLSNDRRYYKDLLQFADEENPKPEHILEIFEINRLRHSLLIDSQVWDWRLYSLDSVLKRSSSPEDLVGLKDSDAHLTYGIHEISFEDNTSKISKSRECLSDAVVFNNERCNTSLLELDSDRGDEMPQDKDSEGHIKPMQHCPSAASILSDQIDYAWSGADQASLEAQPLDVPTGVAVAEALPFRRTNRKESPGFRRLMAPTRVYSFDSAQRLQERIMKGLPPSLFLPTNRSFHASGNYRYMVRDPVMNLQKTSSQVSPGEVGRFNVFPSATPSMISSVPLPPEGARVMVLQNGQEDIVFTVYDNEPTSIISYALCSREYEDWVADRANWPERQTSISLLNKFNSLSPELSSCKSFASVDFDYMNYGSYSSGDTSPMKVSDHSNYPHLRISFGDDSPYTGGKANFSVMCYYAKQFDALQRKCCPSVKDFMCSLSRCRRWSAQGGKSNVYFAKSFDERFIIKQVAKTELDAFEEFAPKYFKNMTEALKGSGSPTCLAKILGIYQVTVKQTKGGKEMKMDLMIMENLFFNKTISKVYDLKGSVRSRYNSDATGANKVLLDTNLLETLRTNPIFLGSKAKRSLERAIWNDTSFLASVDVMDYSLLVGVDEERKELIVGIIDYMRQYTWDKQLETWVKASGILGGPKNASPTIVSPMQYKKRFRKAMTTYFLTVPDQWSS